MSKNSLLRKIWRKWKIYEYDLKAKERMENYIKSNYDDKKINIFLFFAASGANMGDHAIVYAQYKFLNQYEKDVNIIEIGSMDVSASINVVDQLIRSNDLIMLSGGGYLGDEYDEVFFPMLKVLNKFKDYRKIIFPQTVYFKDTKNHYKNVQKFIKAVNSQREIFLFAREEITLKMLEEMFPNKKIHYTPDIVFSLNTIDFDDKRDETILLTLREDVEKNTPIGFAINLKNSINHLGDIKEKDTVISDRVSLKNREIELMNMWQEFSKSKIVITDRLHGMIFSHITKTPCIVLNNYNHKVRSEYEWIKSNKSIYFCESNDISEIQQKISELTKAYPNSYNYNFDKDFVDLRKVLDMWVYNK